MNKMQLNRVAESLENLRKAKLESFKASLPEVPAFGKANFIEWAKKNKAEFADYVLYNMETGRGDYLNNMCERHPFYIKEHQKVRECEAANSLAAAKYDKALADKIRTTMDLLYLSGEGDDALKMIEAFRNYEPGENNK